MLNRKCQESAVRFIYLFILRSTFTGLLLPLLRFFAEFSSLGAVIEFSEKGAVGRSDAPHSMDAAPRAVMRDLQI